ncbi:hypothetical protein KMP13_02720 [Epibacterium ulvae]|uniref:tyrosine-type recombinase/integrase n=1 Tax=Epibacterium ulvae TaxID=1156985 RepID=UPI001BFC38C7|nr:tyrosine-type recombinase/integrase [Epibacterium ulvae]MBT8152821.1 hypothetical protein [Epibacterium ulvae]
MEFRDLINERMLFELMLGTGQRIVDRLDMQCSHIAGDTISVKQNKTKKRLLIPATGELLEALPVHSAAWEHTRRSDKGLFILQKDMSKTKAPEKWAYRGAADTMHKARKSIGLTTIPFVIRQPQSFCSQAVLTTTSQASQAKAWKWCTLHQVRATKDPRTLSAAKKSEFWGCTSPGRKIERQPDCVAGHHPPQLSY